MPVTMLPQVSAQLQLQQRLEGLAGELEADQLQWAAGFLAGLAAAGRAPGVATDARPGQTLTIWYGSETGNGRGVAQRLADAAGKAGHSVDLASLAEVQPRRIARVSHLILVVSTHGEGDPPADARALHQLLHSERAPRLDELRYTVFALGDSSYPDYCRTGRDFDQMLARLGATRLLECREVDVDFEPAEDAWRDEALGAFKGLLTDQAQGPYLQVVRPAQVAAHDRRNPFQAEVLEVSPLTVAPSQKTVSHLALDIAGSGLQYQPGDSLGLWPRHDRQLVEEILEVTRLDADTEVERNGKRQGLQDWLTTGLELTQVVRPFVQAVAEISGDAGLRGILAERDAFQRWAEQRQVIDVLREVPLELDADGLVGMLRGISPRLYSIASSPLVNEDEIHLTVKLEGGAGEHGRLRAGVASWQLTRLMQPGQRLPVYVEANPRFRLPEDPDRPIIMIGPGTGVAPFRAFVEHRQALGHGGRNWLFFGEQHRRTDFLYQLEWQRHLKSGALHRLSVAFSRDQAEKCYVQHRLLEQAPDVHAWLEEGAGVYVCGSGQGMAADVHEALVRVLAGQGGLDRESAQARLDEMAAQGRYQKDVY
jgi:sulfite reductase (NADPH) flavoprotein alpha-component